MVKSKSERFDKLYSIHKDRLNSLEHKAFERQRKEISDCTFIPQVKNSSLTEKEYKKNWLKERRKKANWIPTTRKVRSKSSNLFKPNTNTDTYERLYGDSEKIKEKKRLKEVHFTSEELREWTFAPKKHTHLDYEYLEQFRDPSVRLYNNYFEVQEKISVLKDDRDRELQSLNESKIGHKINLSITNNFINSSISISNQEKEGQPSKFVVSTIIVHEKLYNLNKKKKFKQKIIEDKINRETGCIFKPKINKRSRWSSYDKVRNSRSLYTIKSLTPTKKGTRNSSLFHPNINDNSRKIVNK